MSDSAIYAVYGASGFGREVMPVARESLLNQRKERAKLVFVDDNNSEPVCNGYPLMTYAEFRRFDASQHYAVVAIADSKIRQKLVERLISDGIDIWDIVSPNSMRHDEVTIGCGSIICPFVTLTSNINIGESFHANLYSYVAHDCVIGNYVTFAPGVKCNGNVIIEDHVYVGTGAVIKQGRVGQPLTIGKEAVIGMGAVVTKNVAPGTIVVGNPAKPLNKKN